MNECKVIHKQTSDEDSNSVIFDHFWQYFQINFKFVFMMDQIPYAIHHVNYNIYIV